MFFCVFRSPLSKTNLLEDTPTLIFIGLEDKRVLPEAQGIPLYKAIRSQKLSPTSLYHYSLPKRRSFNKGAVLRQKALR